MTRILLIALLFMPLAAKAHKEPVEGGVCHYFAEQKLHCHYNFRHDDLLLLKEEPPPATQENAATVTPPPQQEDNEEEEEESVKDPLEERRKAAGRQCLQQLKRSCGRLALGDSCVWTARFACEQSLDNAIPSADNAEIDDFIANENHLWQDDQDASAPQETDDSEEGFFSFF